MAGIASYVAWRLEIGWSRGAYLVFPVRSRVAVAHDRPTRACLVANFAKRSAEAVGFTAAEHLDPFEVFDFRRGLDGRSHQEAKHCMAQSKMLLNVRPSFPLERQDVNC